MRGGQLMHALVAEMGRPHRLVGITQSWGRARVPDGWLGEVQRALAGLQVVSIASRRIGNEVGMGVHGVRVGLKED